MLSQMLSLKMGRIVKWTGLREYLVHYIESYSIGLAQTKPIASPWQQNLAKGMKLVN